MQEVSSNEIHVRDVDLVAFKGVLRYLYSGAPPKNITEVDLELFVTADKYGLEELKDMCEVSICDRLDAESVVDALIVAAKIKSKQLYDRAIPVLRSNFASLTEESSQKLKNHPELLFDFAVHFSKE